MVNDDINQSNLANRAIQVNSVNDAPVVTTSGGNNSFTEEGAAIIVDNSITIADVDNSTLTGATVTISNVVAAEDELNFTDQNSITGDYDSSTGILTLSGTTSIANYELALQSIQYNNTNTSIPDVTSRNISFLVNDGIDNSNAGLRIVDIIPVNDAPILSGINGSTSTIFGGDPASLNFHIGK